LLEDVYEEALCHELSLRGLRVERQQSVILEYKGKVLQKRLKLDVIVEDLVIVEGKSVEIYNDIYQAQLLTYLRLTRKKLGIVINFGEQFVRDGVHRVANDIKILVLFAPLRLRAFASNRPPKQCWN